MRPLFLSRAAIILIIVLVLPTTTFAYGYYKDQVGLNVHWALGGIGRDDLYAQRLLESKTMWVREHFQVHNFYLEDPQNWFVRYDKILKKYKEYNINVLGMVAYNESAGKTPPNLEEWRAFLRVLVGRYKDYVKFWEIWNEPDSPDYLIPHNPETYVKILSAAYSEIKNVDPEAKIVSAGLASPNPYFAKKLFKLAADKFDIFAFHAYYCQTYFESGNLATFEEKLQQIKEIVDKYKPKKEVWITELGCSQNGGQFSQKQQKDYLKYIVSEIFKKRFIKRVFLYNIRDYDYWTVYENSFGLTGVNLEPKLAWYWYKRIYVGPYGKQRFSATFEKQKAKELKKKLEVHYGRKNIPKTIAFQDLVDAYLYGGYPEKALAQALKFSGKTYHPKIPFQKWKKTATYKKYINRGWYGGKLVWPQTYKKPRLTLKEEAELAKKLRQELSRRYKFDKLQITKKNWNFIVNAYIYGGYPYEALARAGKFPQIVHPKIPYSRWQKSEVYKLFIKQKVY